MILNCKKQNKIELPLPAYTKKLDNNNHENTVWLDANRQKSLTAIFNLLDRDGNGCITKDEFDQVVLDANTLWIFEIAPSKNFIMEQPE